MFVIFFFNDTATTEIYTLSLHDALPIYLEEREVPGRRPDLLDVRRAEALLAGGQPVVRSPLLPQEIGRSEEHTSELQSRQYLVCRLLLEKKNQTLFQSLLYLLLILLHSQ